MNDVRVLRLGDLEHDPVAIDGNEARYDKLDDLLASLPVHGLNQSLRVRPWQPGVSRPVLRLAANAAPAKKGRGKKDAKAAPISAVPDGEPLYGVVAGNRRLATLRRLRDTGGSILGVAVTDEWPVPAILGDVDDAAAFAITSAENLQRLPPTPVEEFRAFAKMAKVHSVAAIAAHFGVDRKLVQQRLRLADLHDDVLAALEAETIDMAAAQAFTLQPDKKLQAKYLHAAGTSSWKLHANNIKREFTEELVKSDSREAKLIGKKAYVEAGGEIMGDDFGNVAFWISNDIIGQLLEKAMADQVATWLADGWSFVETPQQFGVDTYGYLKSSSRVWPNGEGAFTAEQKAGAGVVYWPDQSQDPRFGIVKSKAEKSSTSSRPPVTLDAPGDARVLELSRIMTAALQQNVGVNAVKALQLLTAGLHVRAHRGYDVPIKIAGEMQPPLPGEPLDDAPRPVGKDFVSALDWAGKQDVPRLLVYLAELIGPNVNVVRAGGAQSAGERAVIDFMDPFVSFDPDAYFAAVSKPVVVEAWNEMRGRLSNPLAPPSDRPALVFNAAGKKGDMAAVAAEAARLTNWRPPQLRTPSYAGPGKLPVAAPSDDIDLDPAYEDSEEDDGGIADDFNEEEQSLEAAE